MGRNKLNFAEMKELQKSNNEEFLKIVFDNFENRDFFNGELRFFVSKEITVEENKTKTITVERFLWLNDREREILINQAKEKWEKEKAEILEEGNRLYDKAITSKQLETYPIDWEVAVVVAMACVGHNLSDYEFRNACYRFSHQKEISGPYWKSYKFKGFIRWEQLEKMMNETSNSTSSTKDALVF